MLKQTHKLYAIWTSRLLALFLFLHAPILVALEPVRLQLKWTHAFQFAGYYAAIDQGYYRDAGFEVELIEGKPGLSVIDEVMNGRAEFGVGTSSLLLSLEQGKKVALLANIFQHSPQVLIAPYQSPFQGIHDLAGKKLMIEEGADELKAYLMDQGIMPSSIELVTHIFSIDPLLTGTVDAMSAYVTHEPFYLNQAGVDVQIYTPRSAGIDFYGDNLFTGKAYAHDNPQRAGAFTQASLRGWEYALHNVEEVVELILANYTQIHSHDFLHFEAEGMYQLIRPDLVELGYINPGRWQHIADTYVELGLLKQQPDLSTFFFRQTETQLQRWLHLLILALLTVVVISGVTFYIYRVNRKLRLLLAEQQRNELLQQDHNHILAMIAGNEPLKTILNAIALSVERFKPGCLCSILLLDRNSNTLNLGAAPSLPDDYNTAIANTPAKPGAGSCGTAAATRQRMIVSDIQTHPYWATFKDVAATAGLAACWSEPILDTHGDVLGTFAIYHASPSVPQADDIKLIEDIARLAEIAIERNRAFDALKNSEERHRLLADHASDVIWTMDLSGRFTYVSPSVEKLRGFSVDEVMQQRPEQLLTETSAKVMHEQLRLAVEQVRLGKPFPPYTGELEQYHKDGSTVWTEVKTSGIYDAQGQFVGIMGVTRDLTERKKTEDKMRYLAQHDPLTGLANRSLFADRIDQAIKLAARQKDHFALMLIDLNDFKPINDQHGHAIGDELLCAIAKRLLSSVRASDTVSRLGGDEFTILLQGIHQLSEAENVKDNILEQMQQPFRLGELEIISSCCIGIAFYPNDGETEIELSLVADQHMYAQKRQLK